MENDDDKLNIKKKEGAVPEFTFKKEQVLDLLSAVLKKNGNLNGHIGPFVIIIEE